MKAFALFALTAAIGFGQSLPPYWAKGALNPAVTQETIGATICKSGWSKTVRPPAAYTNRLKIEQLQRLLILVRLSAEGGPSPADYEEDHRVPLELGGAPRGEENLWPEPWARPYGAHEKDRLENALKRDVCKGKLSLAAAQAVFLGDWWAEYRRRFEKGTPR